MSDDTRFAQAELEMYRRMTPGERFLITLRMSQEAIALARKTLAAARPELSPRELDLLWVEIQYGRELSQKLRAHLAERDARGQSPEPKKE